MTELAGKAAYPHGSHAATATGEPAVPEPAELQPQPESLSAVFWRLTKAGVSTRDIADDPDYRAAMEREKPWPFYDEKGQLR